MFLLILIILVKILSMLTIDHLILLSVDNGQASLCRKYETQCLGMGIGMGLGLKIEAEY